MTDIPFHKDINKRSSDLLTKDFPSEKQENKVEWKGRADPSVTFEANLITKKDGSIVGTFIPKYEIKEYGATVSAELNTNREYKAEVSIKDKIVKGLKLIFSDQIKGDSMFGTAGFEYKQDYVALTGSADYGKANGSTVKASAALGSNGFVAGVAAEYLVGSGAESDLKELNSILSYSTAIYDVAAFGRMKGGSHDASNELGMSFFHKVNRDLAIGGEALFDTSNTDMKPKLSLGGQYAFNADTSLKTKLDTAGKLGVSVQQRYNANAKWTLATTTDITALGAKGASTLGFTLALND